MPDDVQTVRIVPLRRVSWPAPGFYYEVKGRFKLCVAVNDRQGWATFWGAECKNEHYRLEDMGALTEYTLESLPAAG